MDGSNSTRALQGTQANACSVSVVGQNPSVTVNNGSGKRQVVVTQVSSVGHTPSSFINQRQVQATPLLLLVPRPVGTPQPPVGMPQPRGQRSIGKLGKIILKAACRSTKKDSRSFTLRSIDPAEICSCDYLKKVIRKQLHQDITPKDFDVGYVQGSNVVGSRSRDLLKSWFS